MKLAELSKPLHAEHRRGKAEKERRGDRIRGRSDAS